MGIEVQAAGQGNCPGGCDYSLVTSDGTVIKGNYYHAPVFQQDNFAFSLMAASTNAVIINNTAVTETTHCYWPLGIAMENSVNGGTLQGNVMGAVYVDCAGNYNDTHGWSGPIIAGYTFAGSTNYFQNNVACGDQQAGGHLHQDPYDDATNVEQDEYYADACPGGQNLALSDIAAAFTTQDDQSFPNGGMGTWKLGVVSNRSIRRVEFFVDGSAAPDVAQELQDLNDNFAQDRTWLYHATIDTTGLGKGSHTIQAVATDVSGAARTVAQSFNR